MSDLATARDFATTHKLVWFTTSSRWDRLHYVPACATTPDPADIWDAMVDWTGDEPNPHVQTTACGRTTELSAPGILSRMGLPRCRQCCRVLGIPPGYGTPSNWPDEPHMSSKYRERHDDY